jgi:superfamily II DNA or RNA helicase
MIEQGFIEALGFKHIHTLEYSNTTDRSFVYFMQDSNTCLVLDSFDFKHEIPFKYSEYTLRQNKLFATYDHVYRFLLDDPDLENKLHDLLNDNLELSLYYRDNKRNLHAIDNNPLEHRFETCFLQAFPYANSEYLQKEVPFPDDHQVKFIDYVCETDNHRYAMEINGVSYHHPLLIGRTRYLAQLDRQNLLSYYDFKVLRFSTESIIFLDAMVENLRSVIKGTLRSIHTIRSERSFAIGEYSDIDLYEHQEEILGVIRKRRKTKHSAYLVVAPTGSGKTFIACKDMHDANVKSGLVIVPTVALQRQWEKELKNFHLFESVHVVTYLGFIRRNKEYRTSYHDYVIIDEAHHAQAPLFSKMIKQFKADFMLGLTATPERLDRRSLTDIFGHFENNMTIREGVEKGVLSPFRVFRLKSDIDLSEVRINGKDFVNSDLERTLRVSSRNDLIAKTIYKYFDGDPSKKGIVFCVNIAHAKEMSDTMNALGINTRAVVSSYSKERIHETIQAYNKNEFQFLTAVNILTEGFDAPATSVLVMARPTLSKVVYLQQLGRGLRTAPGKKYAYVIDVVDNYGPFGGPWGANSLFGCGYYAPFIDPLSCKLNEQEDLEIFNLFDEKELALKEIDIHTFQEKYGDLYSVEEAARELFINTGTLWNWLKKGEVSADESIPFGKRTLHFFKYGTLENIRTKKNLKKVTDENIKTLFLEYLNEKTYSFSFKMVFLLSLIKNMDKNGNASIERVVDDYRRFYINRLSQNRQIDRKHCVYDDSNLDDIDYMTRSMLNNPFEKFERKRFIFKQKDKDLKVIGFNPRLYDKMDKKDISRIQSLMIEHLKEYYREMNGIDENNPLLQEVNRDGQDV